jgi:hypothetical protein
LRLSKVCIFFDLSCSLVVYMIFGVLGKSITGKILQLMSQGGLAFTRDNLEKVNYLFYVFFKDDIIYFLNDE